MDNSEHTQDCICAWCEVERQNAEMLAAKDKADDRLAGTPCSVIYFSFRGSSGEIEHHVIQASDAASLLSRTMEELESLKRWISQMPNFPQNDNNPATGSK